MGMAACHDLQQSEPGMEMIKTIMGAGMDGRVGAAASPCLQEAEHILAEVGFLSTVLPFGTDATSYGRLSYDKTCSSQEQGSIASEHASSCLTSGSEQSHLGGEARSQSGNTASSNERMLGSDAAGKWLFTSQQMRLSFAQMDVYTTHLAAAEEVDEDFTGHFS
eukprot:340422-Pelagomonas_calceolata.AAC.1